MAVILKKLGGDDRRAADAAIERNVEAYRSDGGYTMPGVALSALVS